MSWYVLGYSCTFIGTEANKRPNDWTMNLEPSKVDRPTVLHETGHALGLVHEHQSPYAESIAWNFPQVNIRHGFIN